MKKWLKSEVCETHEQYTGEQSKVAATIHEQCMNSNRNCSSPTETRLEKKKGVKRKRKTQNVYPNPA